MKVKVGKTYKMKNGDFIRISKDKWSDKFIAFNLFTEEAWHIKEDGTNDFDENHYLIKPINDNDVCNLLDSLTTVCKKLVESKPELEPWVRKNFGKYGVLHDE